MAANACRKVATISAGVSGGSANGRPFSLPRQQDLKHLVAVRVLDEPGPLRCGSPSVLVGYYLACAHFHIGQWHMLRGDIPHAQASLRIVTARYPHYLAECTIARVDLKRLRKLAPDMGAAGPGVCQGAYRLTRGASGLCAVSSDHTGLTPAALMIGHHFSVSAL
jgi:hypothetical protein